MSIHVVAKRNVPDGADAAAFEQAAQTAKDGCPISRALKGNVELSVEATLDN
jgi:osmotically inducible protein OsmC